MKKRRVGRPNVDDPKKYVGLRLRESLIKTIKGVEKESLGKVIEQTMTEKYG